MSAGGSPVGLLMVLWGLSGFFQSVGGPSSYSTIARWTPFEKRGRYLGFWNVSHNIGGALPVVSHCGERTSSSTEVSSGCSSSQLRSHSSSESSVCSSGRMIRRNSGGIGVKKSSRNQSNRKTSLLKA